ncbi:MAG: biopolymer transporter ExbD [Bacteroidaceae bacterium]|nr:biopolymer transporter ExbD [Bacteroidaceae bacterium]
MAKKESKQKKMETRVDFTPMVDMMMLLITFFMLCTSLAKPQTMQLTLPSNKQDTKEENKNETRESETFTIFAAGDNQLYYVAGIPKYDDPTCLKKTTWGKDGIREVFLTHKTGEGIQPVLLMKEAKMKLDMEKQKGKMSDDEYQAKLKDIKSGKVNGQKVHPLTVIIKCTDNASYKNMIDALDEMQICNIGTYVLDKITPDDLKLLESNNVK